MWDNREANVRRDLVLDFRGPELQVENAYKGEALKCIFAEKYLPQVPPSSLKLS